MILKNIEDVVIQEFVCFYHADLIDEEWQDQSVQEELAKASVKRLLANTNEPAKLLELFQSMVKDRNHLMNQILSKETEIEWLIEDEDWISYKLLLETMILLFRAKSDSL